MVKRFAAHYLFMPDLGFVKQHVVEIADGGVVRNVFPLTEEIESVEWLPGVIALLNSLSSDIPMFSASDFNAFHQTSQCFTDTLTLRQKAGEVLYSYLLYPFDFISMQPVVETRSRLLR